MGQCHLPGLSQGTESDESGNRRTATKNTHCKQPADPKSPSFRASPFKTVQVTEEAASPSRSRLLLPRHTGPKSRYHRVLVTKEVTCRAKSQRSLAGEVSGHPRRRGSSEGCRCPPRARARGPAAFDSRSEAAELKDGDKPRGPVPATRGATQTWPPAGTPREGGLGGTALQLRASSPVPGTVFLQVMQRTS
ncbi:hypothetical protein GN956_G18266 [Arapaima gigas]